MRDNVATKMNNKIYVTYDQLEDISCFKEEQETVINWYREDDVAVICTSDFTTVTKLSKLMERDPDNYKCYYYECNRNPDSGRLGNYFFEVPKSLICFRVGRDKKDYSEEELKTVKERFVRGKKNDCIV